ncbi:MULTISPECIES: hypothetical protein [unclassified Streptomyces]|uniref:hypothetical protein n=1 Tax=unclassified Streptomyces TaxID=2593676 RepID=UPI000A83D048|nr:MULTISPECIES: hypothetical protein [unclassified Streptomyces]AZM62674.1 hypothetical protein DLM49_26890 [Streptomyces sp. WAC 01438]RSM89908.1 hypothetical protein DMA10_30215 [Streptomyces sp. WAC 01420]
MPLRDGLTRPLEAHGFEIAAAVGSGPSRPGRSPGTSPTWRPPPGWWYIFVQLGPEVSDDDNRRVPAVLAHPDHGR